MLLSTRPQVTRLRVSRVCGSFFPNERFLRSASISQTGGRALVRLLFHLGMNLSKVQTCEQNGFRSEI